MPLYIEDRLVETMPRSVKDFLNSYKGFEDSSNILTNQKVEVVGPSGLLYVGQREYAGTNTDDDVINLIGSEDATTCHIAVLRHTGSGATSLSHFDGCETKEGLQSMVQLVLELSQNKSQGRLEFHIVGGFEDDRGNSEPVSLSLFNCLMNCNAEIHLMTACIGEYNTVYRNRVAFPVIYGIAVEVKTGRIFNATFPDHGPDMALRSARNFSGHNNLLIYNWKSKQLSIGPFTYIPFDNVDVLLRLPGSFYRKHMSTSPDQEPASFEHNIRQSLQHMKDHPDPMKTLFQGDTPRCYKKRPDGQWEFVQQEPPKHLSPQDKK